MIGPNIKGAKTEPIGTHFVNANILEGIKSLSPFTFWNLPVREDHYPKVCHTARA